LQNSPDSSETVCTECSLVVEESQIDPGPDWRGYTHQEHEENARTGTPQSALLHDDGLTTDISWQDRDANGNRITGRRREQLQRIRKAHKYNRQQGKERQYAAANGEINRMATSLGIPKTIAETAAVLYRRATAESVVIGRSIEGIATACLYAACREHGNHRSLDDFVPVSYQDRRTIMRGYNELCDAIGLTQGLIDPIQHVPTIAGRLSDSVSPTIRDRAKQITAAAVNSRLINGKKPTGLAAASLYIASLEEQDKIIQHKLADVSNTTAVTIRSIYKEITSKGIHQSTSEPSH